MFTDEDVKRIKKLNIEYYEKKESESNGSSLMEERSEDDLYFSKYFLNDCFKILHIQIVSTEEVTVSFARQQSYMTYAVMVVTQEFSYEIKKRYSQFLRLYESIVRQEQLRNRSEIDPPMEIMNVGKINKLQYTFPPKKLSSSLLNFFNKSNKQKLAQERKSDLSFFLNQIRSNYYKFPSQFVEHYIELLKFINMKEQHQKYWRRKEGRFLQLSNLTLKDTNLPNVGAKGNQKQGESQINIDHLSELLQHQINKINLAVTANESVRKSNFRYSQIQETNNSNDLMVTSDIIKNVDCIQDIVLEMKRKINYDHIRCILKGKDIKQQSNAPLSKTKKGLIQYSLKHTTNELVSMHILKTVLNVFMNSECNYSCDAFIKVLSEIDLAIFALPEEKEECALQNKQFRQIYFKLLKQYIAARQQYGSEKKNSNFPLQKLMGLVLVNLFRNWNEHSDKNKSFKLKDEQKQWTMIIDDTTRYSPKKFNSQSSLVKSAKQEDNKDEQKERKSKDLNKFTKMKQGQFIKLNLTTEKSPDIYKYLLKAEIKNKTYKECVEIMKDQFKWNPLLIRSQIDIYSHTKKDIFKMPGKQEKIFRFVENQEIQMDLNDQEQQDLVQFENVVPDRNQEDIEKIISEKDPKMSTQTMPSTSGSCAFEHEPEIVLKQKVEVLSHSLDSYQTSFIKSPPKEPLIQSFYQKIKVERILREKTKEELCGVEIQIILTQPSAMKYFLSQIEGTTLIIWDGFNKAFEFNSEQSEQTV